MEDPKELKALVILVTSLAPQEQAVLLLRYGRLLLGEEKPLSYAKIGSRLGMSSDKVKTRLRKALRKVRHTTRSKWASEFL